jgi:ankyrin repeat protein
LESAIMIGDATETQRILQAGRFKQSELDSALFYAVYSDFDNTACIRLLLRAGANVNARAADEETTPLMVAVARPCNLKPLLDGGADRDAREKSGRTAIEIARQQKVSVAVQLLEQAGAQ